MCVGGGKGGGHIQQSMQERSIIQGCVWLRAVVEQVHILARHQACRCVCVFGGGGTNSRHRIGGTAPACCSTVKRQCVGLCTHSLDQKAMPLSSYTINIIKLCYSTHSPVPCPPEKSTTTSQHSAGPICRMVMGGWGGNPHTRSTPCPTHTPTHRTAHFACLLSALLHPILSVTKSRLLDCPMPGLSHGFRITSRPVGLRVQAP